MLFLTFEIRVLTFILQQRRHMVSTFIHTTVIQHLNINLLDGVPTIPPTWLGYRHQYVPSYFPGSHILTQKCSGTEYWVSKDPSKSLMLVETGDTD